MAFEMLDSGETGTIIKVIGVGGAGGNVINNMIRRGMKGVDFIVANTDRQALSRSETDNQIPLGHTGLGAGGRPEMGMQAANEQREEIAERLRGANMVFITAGMGGGTGTGASSIVAEVAQELGILTVAVVTKPFSFEGSRRMRNAESGLKALKSRVHSLIVILNDKLEDELGEDADLDTCFAKADDVLYNACSGIAEIILCPGLINTDFEDVRTVMSERGTAMMGAAEASGPDRAPSAASAAISSPLLEGVDLKGAKGVLVNISAPRNVRIKEVREAMNTISSFADDDATIIMGCVYDDSLEAEDKIRVTVIATGLDQEGVDDGNGLITPIDKLNTPMMESPLWRQRESGNQPSPAQPTTNQLWQPQQPADNAQAQNQYSRPFEPAGQREAQQQAPAASSFQAPAPQPAAPQQTTVNQNPYSAQPQQEPREAAQGVQQQSPFSVNRQPQQPQPPQQPQQVRQPQKEQPAPQKPQKSSDPFEIPAIYPRPISTPDGQGQNPGVAFGGQQTLFGSNGQGFATLNNNGNSGLWSQGASVPDSQDQRKTEGGEDRLRFDEIPAFLRKK